MRRSRRPRARLQSYVHMDGGTPIFDSDDFRKLLTTFPFTDLHVPRLRGADFTWDFVNYHGLFAPLILDDTVGSGLRVPAPSTSVTDIANTLGESFPVEVIEVATQVTLPGWSLGDWAAYFDNPDQRDRVLNVISCEITGTPLGDEVDAPHVVRELDWADRHWPEGERYSHDFPRVQRYCLMSTEGSFTDFHIDFGGSSVWYHVLRGSKTFLLVKPSRSNLAKFGKWQAEAAGDRVFFARAVDACYRVDVRAGETVILPAGWIHAVFTPVDSLVFGGNFLHGVNIIPQLRTRAVETASRVHHRFLFPCFQQACWYAAAHYVKALQHLQRLKEQGAASAEAADDAEARKMRLTRWEKAQMPALLLQLRRWSRGRDMRIPHAGRKAEKTAAENASAAASYAAQACGVQDELDLLRLWEDLIRGRAQGAGGTSASRKLRLKIGGGGGSGGGGAATSAGGDATAAGSAGGAAAGAGAGRSRLDQLFGSSWLEMETQASSPFHPADARADEAPLLLGVPRADRLPPVPRPTLRPPLSAEEEEGADDPARASATSHIPRAPPQSAEERRSAAAAADAAAEAGGGAGREGGDEDEEFAPDAAATAEGEEYEEEEEEEEEEDLDLDDDDDFLEGGSEEEEAPPRKRRGRPSAPASAPKPRPKPRAEPAAAAAVPLRKMSHRQILNRLRRKR